MVVLKAYAKVNLSLIVTGVRSDGYHLLDTVMQTVDLYDEVRVSKRNDGKIIVDCDNESIVGENNICYMAAKVFLNEIGENGGANISIVKNIPTAAGLGGGSSDAAATLNGLNELYNFPVSESKLCELALKLGADVPFLIRGGTARVRGIGEQITNFETKNPVFLLLVKDGKKPSTASMYKKLDETANYLHNSDVSDICQKSLENGDFGSFKASFVNDFNEVYEFDSIKSELINFGAEAVSLSGSGPTVMGLFENFDSLLYAYEKLKEKYKFIYPVKSVAE